MRFKGLDLNLLLALDILVEERSVSRAAERLHMSQPAMSAALGRLRDYFNDPILAAHGKRMIPTAQAMLLRPMIRDVLAGVDGMISVSSSFDPATSRRRFRTGTSDYLATVLFAPLVPRLQRLAPNVTLDIVQPSEALLVQLDQGEIDLVITPDEHISPDHPAELLFEERHVVAGWTGNPLLGGGLSEDDFFGAGHVAVGIGRQRGQSFAETHLRGRGRERRVEMHVASFLLAPEMLVGTNRLSVMHERLARTFAARMAIAYVDLPFPFPLMREMIQFHRTRATDPGLRWFIEQVRAAVDHPSS